MFSGMAGELQLVPAFLVFPRALHATPRTQSHLVFSTCWLLFEFFPFFPQPTFGLPLTVHTTTTQPAIIIQATPLSTLASTPPCPDV